MTISPAHIACEFLQKKRPNFNPKVGIVLGSGLGDFVNELTDTTSYDYKDIPHFPMVNVSGHKGALTFGFLNDIPVVCLQGRSHTYEGHGFDAVKNYVRTLHCLGCEYFIATNAAGSLHADMPPGELMLINDHINLQASNPLIGPNDDNFGPRFIPLENAYDKDTREHFLKVAAQHNLSLHQGVYICVPGPNFETAAEIRAFKILGADAVGMSTVPEILVANHCGMKVAAISVITNFATGLGSFSHHSHVEVLNVAQRATKNLTHLLNQAVSSLS